MVPGPSSVLAALVVSGLPTDRFCVEGFLPRKGAERRRRLAALAAEERTTVVLEAPGRLAPPWPSWPTACGDRPVAVARELTKLHEEVWRGTPAGAAAAEFAGPTGPRARWWSCSAARRRRSRPRRRRWPTRWPSGWRPATAPARRPRRSPRPLGVPRRRAYELAIALRDRDRSPAGRADRPGARRASGPAAG